MTPDADRVASSVSTALAAPPNAEELLALIEADRAERADNVAPDYVLDVAKVIAEFDPQLRAMSPPCKLTPTVAVRLLMAIREGAHYETACARARISYSTFVSWRNRAEDFPEDGPWPALMQAVKLAEADAELESICDVRVAAKTPKFWAAAMTFLERRHPDRWKRQDTIVSQVNVGVAIGVQVSDEQRRAQLPRLPGLSPVAGNTYPVSLSAETAVSGELVEAKATPNGGVSPCSVS
jgi:hypothetical protein